MNARRTPQKKGGSNSRRGIRRRDFLATTAAAGAGFWLASPLRAAKPASKNGELHVAIIGAGTQGREVLIENCLKIPGIRFVAVCDIWPYNKLYASGRLKAYKQEVNAYEDYREMLEKEKALDAVIVATPDWMHAEHAIACLQAGKHVYCEKEMSNSLEKAKQMVLAARQTGKLLQIGHQRRSNPLYTYSLEKIIRDAKLLGRITTTYGQWNRGKSAVDPGCPKGKELDEATLQKYGYDTMHQLLNWRWYRKYGGGPIEDLGSHQIDVFNWFLGTPPKSVMASGGTDYYKGREWYDNVMAIYEYDTPAGVVRALYQVLTTTSARGYYETFMGDEGTLQISEDPRKCRVYAEGHLPLGAWDEWVKKGYLIELPWKVPEDKSETDAIVDIYKSPEQVGWLLPVKPEGSYHQAHLENFFDAIRNGTPLNCPPEVAYETAVAVLTVNDAVAAAKRIDFQPEEFKV